MFLAITGCSAKKKVDEPKPPEPPNTIIAPENEVNTQRRPKDDTDRQFCDGLARVVASESIGFADLRDDSIGESNWNGVVDFPKNFQCEIDGGSFPGATYRCLEPIILADNGSILNQHFEKLAERLDACFAQPYWYPRKWQRGRLFQFAGGERQLMWRDTATLPKPAVTLAIEESIDVRAYRIRLSVFTLR